MILHIATRQEWENAQSLGIYRTRSLDTQGFIHCSYPDQLVRVANFLFHGHNDLVLLVIESNRVHSDVREDEGPDTYPHIYGPLNLDSVTKVLDFRPNKNGDFEMPANLGQPQKKESAKPTV